MKKREPKIYTLERVTILPTSLAQAWSFFSNPQNLTFITPPEMRFEIVSSLNPGEFREGLIIEYTVSPVAGIPLRWVSEIQMIEVERQFHDIQIKGPYASWHHYHLFREVPEGVEMSDIVRYQMPYGFIGELAHRFLVRKKLEHIFDYRAKRIQFLFNQVKGRTFSGRASQAVE